MRIAVSTLLAVPLLMFTLWCSSAGAAVVTPSDFLVTQLEFIGGSVDFSGRLSHKLDQVFDQPGLLVMNRYQPGPDIVSPVMEHRRTFSLFTSGVQGNPAPTATVNGNKITVDLSSLFFGVSQGDWLQAWNIGGIATGSFNSDTLEFCLTWDHLFGGRHKSLPVSFSLEGHVVKFDTTPVPLVQTFVLFATGLAMVVGIWRRMGDVRKTRSLSAV